jgi:hypothetical protein
MLVSIKRKDTLLSAQNSEAKEELPVSTKKL